MKIYVASSWRNPIQPSTVSLLRQLGHEVYDFRNPPNRSGFGWEQINENWKFWTVEQYRQALDHPIAIEGYLSDFNAMLEADACVLVLPSGASSHAEAGYMAGIGKRVLVYTVQPCEPELMYKMFDGITSAAVELNEQLVNIEKDLFMNSLEVTIDD